MKDNILTILVIIFFISIFAIFGAAMQSSIQATESYRPVTVQDCEKYCHPYAVNTIVPGIQEKTVHDVFLWYKFDSVRHVDMYRVCTCKPK